MTLRRPKNPGSRAHLTRTPEQEIAFRVFRLRGLYWMAFCLSGERLQAFRRLVDAELELLGVENETDRNARRRREWDARWAAEDYARARARAERDADLPF